MSNKEKVGILVNFDGVWEISGMKSVFYFAVNQCTAYNSRISSSLLIPRLGTLTVLAKNSWFAFASTQTRHLGHCALFSIQADYVQYGSEAFLKILKIT